MKVKALIDGIEIDENDKELCGKRCKPIDILCGRYGASRVSVCMDDESCEYRHFRTPACIKAVQDARELERQKNEYAHEAGYRPTARGRR